MKKPNNISTTTLSVVIIVLIISAGILIISGKGIVSLSNGINAELETEIMYLDGTTDTISSELRLGSLIASKNNKPINTVTYTPSITSKSPEIIYINYSVVAIDSSKNVIFLKNTNQQLAVTEITKNQRQQLQPLSITSSELLSEITSPQSINLVMVMTINGIGLQSETITIEISNQQPAIGAQPYIPPPPPPLPAATTSGGYSTSQSTPVPTATQQYNDLQLRVVEISGSFS